MLINDNVVEVNRIKRKMWFAYWSLGNTCTYSCSYCPEEFHSGSQPYQFTNAIQNTLKRMPPTFVMFTGGEPTYHPDFEKIETECRDQAIKLFDDAVAQEKKWAEYLFKDGSMIGLNEQLLSQYVDWLTCKRMTAVGLDCGMKPGSNPLPWTQKWIAGSEVQVAPQETEISSYVIGGTKQDVDSNTFKGFSL